MPQANDKYIVFKRADWLRYEVEGPPPTEVEDAVVIRRQDIFAGPAFHAYAACISMVHSIYPMPPLDQDELDRVEALKRSADYFHEQAVLADDLAGAGLAKLPD
jgi:hypothetical protein